MNRRAGEEEPYVLGLDEADAQRLPYARELRAIGQALEDKELRSLDLELDGEDYVARGVRPRSACGPSIFDALRGLISSLTAGENDRPTTASDLQTRFTSEQIHIIESQGRNRRRDPNQTPDAYSLSQLLRGAGAYVDKKRNASLIGVSVSDRWITLRYRTADGRIEETKQDIEFFYNYWVKMYLQRSNRPKMPPASPPGLISTWK
jgi:hypothetical protein